MAFCFSEEMMRKMGRLYADNKYPPTTNLHRFLVKCYLGASTMPPQMGDINDNDTRRFTDLMKAGIIAEDAFSSVKFTSPLAARCYSKYLFPDYLFPRREYSHSSSLKDLIKKVTGKMSPSELHFQVEFTFRRQFLTGLGLCTEVSSIHPQLFKVFPALPDQRGKRKGVEITLYLGGNRRWGIEVLVNGDKTGGVTSQFAPEWKYAALAAKDYAVIDFRSGESTEIVRKPERITVLFKPGDFSSCQCFVGLEKDTEWISLKN
ncbi:hypothetical protein V7S43_008584 [Phytophthora oleae]|uniref:Uncharacterized protein n=1 Tax=Phytophthora oleae TaxID=2107226 RepID=A0ABD3FHD1_9STRA